MAYETPEQIAADPTIYSPDLVDKFSFGGNVFIREGEYEKVWKALQKAGEIMQANHIEGPY